MQYFYSFPFFPVFRWTKVLIMQVAPRGSAMDADAYGNSGDVEATWAMQAMDHAECHMSLLLSGTSREFKVGKYNYRKSLLWTKRGSDIDIIIVSLRYGKVPKASSFISNAVSFTNKYDPNMVANSVVLMKTY